MEVIGYVEEFGEIRSVNLLDHTYEPSDAMQKLAVKEDGKEGFIWAKLVAVEQPLFKD